MIPADLGIKLENVTIDMLGRVKTVIVEKESTTISRGTVRRSTSTAGLPNQSANRRDDL